MKPLELARLPVLAWATFSGPKRSTIPCILDRRDICYTVSGRAAIFRALNALRIRAGDRVLVPTYHCPTMIAPVVAVGADPVFFPIDVNGAPMLDALDRVDTSGVKAMIAAHYFGIPQPMASVRAFCDTLGIALIEDCAHALFGTSDGRVVGSWGDYAIASLTKFLPVSEGGCLLQASDSRPLAPSKTLPVRDELKSLWNCVESGATHGRLPGVNGALRTLFQLFSALRGRSASKCNDESLARSTNAAERWLLDFAPDSKANFAPSKWTIWVASHAHRERIVARRKHNYSRLVALSREVQGARPLRPELPDHAAPYVFPLWVDEPARAYAAIRAAGIPVFRWDETWPTCPRLEGDHGAGWSTHVLQLGCHQELSPTDLSRMMERLANILATSVVRQDSQRAPASFTSRRSRSAPLRDA